MIKLRKALKAHLLTLHEKVYFEEAPEKAIFPYVVFDFPSSIDDGEEFQNIVVDIEAWDKNSTNDTTVIETLINSINIGLNKKTISNSEIGVTFYLENKLSIVDTDSRIKRRRYTYQARLWEVI